MTKSKSQAHHSHTEKSDVRIHGKKKKKKSSAQTRAHPIDSLTYRGKPDRRPIKFIFVNTDGNICLAPSLTWICTNYRLSKGSISDVQNKKVRSYMGWYSVDLSKLDEVVKLLGFDATSWIPVIGKYKADPDQSYEFAMKQDLSFFSATV